MRHNGWHAIPLWLIASSMAQLPLIIFTSCYIYCAGDPAKSSGLPHLQWHDFLAPKPSLPVQPEPWILVSSCACGHTHTEDRCWETDALKEMVNVKEISAKGSGWGWTSRSASGHLGEDKEKPLCRCAHRQNPLGSGALLPPTITLGMGVGFLYRRKQTRSENMDINSWNGIWRCRMLAFFSWSLPRLLSGRHKAFKNKSEKIGQAKKCCKIWQDMGVTSAMLFRGMDTFHWGTWTSSQKTTAGSHQSR